MWYCSSLNSNLSQAALHQSNYWIALLCHVNHPPQLLKCCLVFPEVRLPYYCCCPLACGYTFLGIIDSRCIYASKSVFASYRSETCFCLLLCYPLSGEESFGSLSDLVLLVDLWKGSHIQGSYVIWLKWVRKLKCVSLYSNPHRSNNILVPSFLNDFYNYF